MKINNLRTQIKDYSQNELQTLITEMYKAIPKKVKEEKDLDQLINDPEFFKKKRKQSNAATKIVNMESLASEINTFIDYANKDYYFAPNRVVPKKERSKWRFKAKRFYNDLIAAYQTPENQNEATACMENLYRLFCKSTGYYIFVNPEPFEALNISQETFLEQTLRMKKGLEEPRTWVKNAIDLTLNNKDDRRYYRTDINEVFVSLLQTPPLIELALTEAKELHQKKAKQIPKAKKRGLYELEEVINNIIEVIFLCYVKRHEWDEAISYFKEYHLESNQEIKLFRLLILLETYDRTKEWQQVYNTAIHEGIQPRNELKNKYTFLREQSKFPTFEDRISMLNNNTMGGGN